MTDIPSAVRSAGIVGAGGAGFPTYVKVQPADSVDTLIANGAECEPLLQVDKAVICSMAERVLRGMDIAAQSIGATRKVIAVKRKYRDVLAALSRAHTRHHDIEIYPLDNFYPAGDEQVLVEEVTGATGATGRVVPEGGIPLEVGAVVDNVVTLAWIADAVDQGRPVTARPLCIVGAVNKPLVCQLPIGTTIGDALKLAGGPSVDDPAVIVGGPMMGQLATDLDTPIDKRTSGLLVLPSSHQLIRRKTASMDYEYKLSRTACCQCRFCTDLCPRYMLGHDLTPHTAMRGINYLRGFEADVRPEHTLAHICCQCGVCEVYACPLMLSPRKVYQELVDQLRQAKVPNPHRKAELTPRPSYKQRRIPQPRLIARLGLSSYAHQDYSVDWGDKGIRRVRVPLCQHIGAPCQPAVQPGDAVTVGQPVGIPPDGALGAPVHASIDGTVVSVEGGVVEIAAPSR